MHRIKVTTIRKEHFKRGFGLVMLIAILVPAAILMFILTNVWSAANKCSE